MNNVHIVMMGKGGVGKSTIAVLLAQFPRKESIELHCADLDPTNASFHAFKAIGAEHINIADDEFNIDPVGFDMLMEKILTEESDWVIDTGAATFMPFMNYIVQNEIFQSLEQHGRKVIIHTLLVGGPAMEENNSWIEGTAPVECFSYRGLGK